LGRNKRVPTSPETETTQLAVALLGRRGRDLIGDGDDADGRGVFGGGEDKNLRVWDGMQVRRGSDNLGFKVVVWRRRRSWRRVEGLEGGLGAVEDW
jgi:hypothetical protein